MSRTLLMIAGILGAIGVGLGAFGAHGLAATFAANGRAATFDTAVQYHLVHVLALLLTALLLKQNAQRWLTWAGYLFIAGIILFSGSLYILAVFDLRVMGAVAPLGGTAFIAGWLCIVASAWKAEH